MKRPLRVHITRLLLAGLMLYSALGYSQSFSGSAIELSVLQYSTAAHSAPVHEYLLKAVNTSGQPLKVRIRTTNTDCDKKLSVDLDQEVYWTGQGFQGGLTNMTQVYTIPANGSIEFTLRTRRPVQTTLNSWNCTRVEALDDNNASLSNVVVIESFIPDPKDFR